MRVRSKKLWVRVAGGAVGLSALGIAARAAATSVVVLNPAEMKGGVSFSAETLTNYVVYASSSDSDQLHTQGNFTTSPYSLTVESGHSYYPSIEAYFSNANASTSLRIDQWAPVFVDNAYGPTMVDFNYPNTSHVNFTINVTGGKVNSYQLYASASSYENGSSKSYFSDTYNFFSTPWPASTTSWFAMVSNSAVYVYGTAYLTATDGTQIMRDLPGQNISLSPGQASVSWPIDLTNKGTLAGNIALTPGSSISSQSVNFRGVYSTPSYGTNGSKPVATNGSYTFDLPPGQYDVYLRSDFTSQYVETKASRITITAGSTTTQNFVEALGTGQAPLNVGGFFTNADLSYAYLSVRGEDSSAPFQASASDWSPIIGQVNFLLTSGVWKRSSLSLGLDNLSDPQLPLHANYTRYHHTDSSVLPVAVVPEGVQSLGAEEVTLVRSNAYFYVKGSSAHVSSPYVSGDGLDYNGDQSMRTYKTFYSYGSWEPKPTSALTMVAEPGTYNMNAFATVNGSVVQFSSQDVTFGTPVPTLAGTNVTTTLIESTPLTVTLDFPQVTSAGVTTVVETPLGPEPPEGFQSFCVDGNIAGGQFGGGPECPPIYYDIETTATFPSGQNDLPVKVCVRRQLLGQPPTDFLVLGHYNDSDSKWEILKTPPDMAAPAFNCIEDLQACGCADEASCGIDYSDPDHPVDAYMVCGMTKSFSPYTVLKGDIKFTNEVNGMSYEGPTGPPSLQSWTVRNDGVYRITATGARGAAATQAAQGISGGCGAQISGEFNLQVGDSLQLIVGQKGLSSPYSGGGGGGTFVTLNGSPLVVAGGGGGVRSGALVNGRSGSTETAGVKGSTSSNYMSGFIAGGVNGLGGSRILSYGSSGAGWLGDGASDGTYGEGGFAISGLLAGRGGLGKSCGGLAHGGYGGGGAGNGCYGGGGGGGYSGGAGGRVAGGGGSFNAGTKPRATEGACTSSGHGVVTITHVSQ